MSGLLLNLADMRHKPFGEHHLHVYLALGPMVSTL